MLVLDQINIGGSGSHQRIHFVHPTIFYGRRVSLMDTNTHTKFTWQKTTLLVLGGLFAAFIITGLLFAIFRPIEVLPRMRLVPGFTLVNQNAKALSNEDLRGHIVLYNFTYTNCPEPCADISETMQTIQQSASEMDFKGIPFSMVTISFDPENDTPRVLKDYAESLDANPDIWQFATLNNPRLLKTIVGGSFEAYYEEQTDGSFDFMPTYVLVDGWGIVRGQYAYETLASTTERITRHIGVLAEEMAKSVGANKLLYETAHLFVCYAP